jgi:hypothetical protein
VLEPLVAIIVGDDCAPPAFSSPQSAFLNFRISRGASDSVPIAKFLNAHRPLPRATLPLGF